MLHIVHLLVFQVAMTYSAFRGITLPILHIGGNVFQDECIVYVIKKSYVTTNSVTLNVSYRAPPNA